MWQEAEHTKYALIQQRGYDLAPDPGLILPASNGHPVKPVNFATEGSYDEQDRYGKDSPTDNPPEFRAEALALTAKIDVPEAAKELGLHDSHLHGWRSKARAKRNQSDREQSQAAEIARLKRQLVELAVEPAIVKKSATWLAKSLK